MLYYSESQTFQIKQVDLSVTPINPTTLVGSFGIGGHFDGPAPIALINKPGDLILNSKEDLLYFIDGSSIRSINLDDSISGEYQVATISKETLSEQVSSIVMVREHYLLNQHIYIMKLAPVKTLST